jgi:hypothetical protein
MELQTGGQATKNLAMFWGKPRGLLLRDGKAEGGAGALQQNDLTRC